MYNEKNVEIMRDEDVLNTPYNSRNAGISEHDYLEPIQLIPGTNIPLPRYRGPFETDEHYAAFLAEYYSRFNFPKKEIIEWDPRLTEEQILDAYARDIYEPKGPEYEQFLNELGLGNLKGGTTPIVEETTITKPDPVIEEDYIPVPGYMVTKPEEVVQNRVETQVVPERVQEETEERTNENEHVIQKGENRFNEFFENMGQTTQEEQEEEEVQEEAKEEVDEQPQINIEAEEAKKRERIQRLTNIFNSLRIKRQQEEEEQENYKEEANEEDLTPEELHSITNVEKINEDIIHETNNIHEVTTTEGNTEPTEDKDVEDLSNDITNQMSNRNRGTEGVDETTSEETNEEVEERDFKAPDIIRENPYDKYHFNDDEYDPDGELTDEEKIETAAYKVVGKRKPNVPLISAATVGAIAAIFGVLTVNLPAIVGGFGILGGSGVFAVRDILRAIQKHRIKKIAKHHNVKVYFGLNGDIQMRDANGRVPTGNLRDEIEADLRDIIYDPKEDEKDDSGLGDFEDAPLTVNNLNRAFTVDGNQVGKFFVSKKENQEYIENIQNKSEGGSAIKPIGSLHRSDDAEEYEKEFSHDNDTRNEIESYVAPSNEYIDQKKFIDILKHMPTFKDEDGDDYHLDSMDLKSVEEAGSKDAAQYTFDANENEYTLYLTEEEIDELTKILNDHYFTEAFGEYVYVSGVGIRRIGDNFQLPVLLKQRLNSETNEQEEVSSIKIR